MSRWMKGGLKEGWESLARRLTLLREQLGAVRSSSPVGAVLVNQACSVDPDTWQT